VLAAFKSSSLVSSKKHILLSLFELSLSYFIFNLVGKSSKGASLLKIGSKRKRTKREIEDEKAKKLQQEQEIAEKFENIQQME
jgi:hypothetical protein